MCPTLCDPIDGSPPGSPVPGMDSSSGQSGTSWVSLGLWSSSLDGWPFLGGPLALPLLPKRKCISLPSYVDVDLCFLVDIDLCFQATPGLFPESQCQEDVCSLVLENQQGCAVRKGLLRMDTWRENLKPASLVPEVHHQKLPEDMLLLAQDQPS